jgi:outer membrane immunogenic protein
MKKFFAEVVAAASFCATAALAAPPADQMFNWTGFYVGGQAGGAWGHQDSAYCRGFACATGFNAFDAHGVSGFLGGAQAGYRIQTNNNWVLGIEGDFNWAHVTGGTLCSDPTAFGVNSTCHSKADRFATVTGQFGFTTGQALFYGKGGAAWMHQSYIIINPNNPSPCPTPANCRNDGSETRMGWTLGTGVAYAFDPKWSASLEYDYMNFGTKAVHMFCTTACFTPVITDFPMNVTQHVHAIKAGINYRFD